MHFTLYCRYICTEFLFFQFWLNISFHKISNKKVGKKIHGLFLWIVDCFWPKSQVKLPHSSENWHFRAKNRLCAYKSAIQYMLYLKQSCTMEPNSFLSIIWFYQGYQITEGGLILTANIFESGPMPTPWKILAGPPLLPSCKLG